jgi:hypothetical protein
MDNLVKNKQKDFTLTLLEKHMREIEWMKKFSNPGFEECLYFCFENEPNISCGDRFKVKIAIDKQSVIQFNAKVLDIIPPLILPPDKDKMVVHISLLSKYLRQEIVEKLKVYYLEGKAERADWTIYFQKVI